MKKAQSNAAVQAVVAVAVEEQLAKIISESKGVIDENSLRAWNSDDVLTVYDSLARAHELINKLALVPESSEPNAFTVPNITPQSRHIKTP